MKSRVAGAWSLLQERSTHWYVEAVERVHGLEPADERGQALIEYGLLAALLAIAAIAVLAGISLGVRSEFRHIQRFLRRHHLY